MKILVTGGNGFIGRGLVARLRAQNHTVVPMGRFYADVADWDRYGRFDVCFHLADNNDTQSVDQWSILRSNYFRPVEFFNRVLCDRFVVASSCAVYGLREPPFREKMVGHRLLDCPTTTYYAMCKWLVESWLRCWCEKQRNKRVIALRYSNVYGPGEASKRTRASMVYQIYQNHRETHIRPRLFKFGEQRRDWVYIEDVQNANLLALDWLMDDPTDSRFEVYNIGAGESQTFNRIVEIVNRHLGKSLLPEYVRCPFSESYQEHTECDITEAGKKLGFSPKYDLVEGLKALHDSWIGGSDERG